MILRLEHDDFLRLREAGGACVEVLRGRVWLTEQGREADRFLSPGGRYRIAGDGLVLIGAEVGAEIAVKAS